MAAERPTTRLLRFRVRWATSSEPTHSGQRKGHMGVLPLPQRPKGNGERGRKAALAFVKANDPKAWYAKVRAVRIRESPGGARDNWFIEQAHIVYPSGQRGQASLRRVTSTIVAHGQELGFLSIRTGARCKSDIFDNGVMSRQRPDTLKAFHDPREEDAMVWPRWGVEVREEPVPNALFEPLC